MNKLTLSTISLFLGVFPLTAADWPQWRGPNRDGVSDAKLPESLPKKLTKSWSVEVGEGHSSPVLVGDRVYQHSRFNDEEVLRSLNLKDGKELLKVTNKAPYEMHAAATAHGKGPKSTPAVVDGRVYTFGISGILICTDTHSGEVVWRQEFAKKFKTTSPLYGTATSPLVADGLCVAHVGGHNKGSLAAFDIKTGEMKWSASTDGPGYTSPILTEIRGTKIMITQTQNHLLGVDFTTGMLLWQKEFTTPYDQNSVTPLLIGKRLFYSGCDRPLTAVDLSKGKDSVTAEEAWNNKAIALYMSSPVAVGDRLFGFSMKRRGQLVCVGTADGKLIWENEGRTGENASLIAVGKRVFVLTTEGKMLVLNAEAEKFAPIAEYKVAETATWAHPVILNDGFLIKDAKHLTRWVFE